MRLTMNRERANMQPFHAAGFNDTDIMRFHQPEGIDATQKV